MHAETYPQMPFASKQKAIGPLLERIVREDRWAEITGIFAYATAKGMLELLHPIESLSQKPSRRWLFGLDDCLTEPGAIELAGLSGCTVRVASLLSANRRFHPKVLHFASRDGLSDTVIIGSANLTLNGLTKNAEAIAILRAESRSDVAALRKLASSLFSLGHAPSEKELVDYRRAYKDARPHHRRVAQLTPKSSRPRKRAEESRNVEDSSISLGLDPTIATQCWIEVGKNTAQGRELEIKAEQALFFGLHHSGGDRQARKFGLSDRSSVSMNFKYQGNAMWRLQMRNEVPEVRRGLRPLVNGRLGRSPYVAVFQRTKRRNTFTLRFVLKESSFFRRLKRETDSSGTVGHTTSRQFGWS
jgi:HKD family nuclease